MDCCPQASTLKLPMTIFAGILSAVARRATKLHDTELDLLMCRLALYEQADPYSSGYVPDIVDTLIDRLDAEKKDKIKKIKKKKGKTG